MKITLIKQFVIFAAIVFSHNLLAQKALPEFYAKYAIKVFGLKVAIAHYKLKYTKTGYVFTQNTDLYGVVTYFRDDTVRVASYVDQVGDQLLLQKYTYIQTGEEENKDEEFSIQWDTSTTPAKGKISGIVRSKEINLETSTPVWEPLSFQLPLMLDANKDTKKYHYQAVIKGEIEPYDFILRSTKTIRFANKEYLALQVVYSDPNRDRQLHVWLLPALHNIPVFIESYRDGSVNSRAQLESVKFNNDKTLSQHPDDNNDEDAHDY